MSQTPRLHLHYPVGTDPADVPSDNGALALGIDRAAVYDQGALTGRPAAGLAGSFYLDTASGTLFLDTGTAWIALNTVPVEPPGTLKLTARATPDAGYLFCDGAAVSRTTYAALFDAIGSKYGAGNGTSTFNLPNALGRVMLGGAPADLGRQGGAASVVLSGAQMPSHAHGGGTAGMNAANPHSHVNSLMNVFPYSPPGGGVNVFSPDASNIGVAWPNAAVDVNHAHAITAEGGSQAHENMPPYVTVAVEIRT